MRSPADRGTKLLEHLADNDGATGVEAPADRGRGPRIDHGRVPRTRELQRCLPPSLSQHP